MSDRWLGVGAGTALVATSVVAVVSGVIWARMLPLVRATVWADESTRFLGENVWLGLAGSLWIPYGGNLQFVPRVGGSVALHLGASRTSRARRPRCSASARDSSPHWSSSSSARSRSPAPRPCSLAFPWPSSRRSRRDRSEQREPALVRIRHDTIPLRPPADAGVLHGRPHGRHARVRLSEKQMVVFTPLLRGISDRRKLPVVAAATVGLAAQFVTLAWRHARRVTPSP